MIEQESISSEVNETVTDTAVSTNSTSNDDWGSLMDASREKFGIGGKARETATKAEAKVETDKPANDPKETPVDNKVAPTEPSNANKDAKADKPNKTQARIDELVAKNSRLKAEKSKLLNEIEELKKLKQSAPKVDDYDSPRDYDKAVLKHELKVENAEEAIKEKVGKSRESEWQEWESRAKEQVDNYEEFERTLDDRTIQYLATNEPEVWQFATTSLVGPKMLDSIIRDVFKNPKARQQWEALSPMGKVQGLARLESAVISQMNGSNAQAPQPKEQQVSNAPKSFAPIKSSAPVAKRDTDDWGYLMSQSKKKYGLA